MIAAAVVVVAAAAVAGYKLYCNKIETLWVKSRTIVLEQLTMPPSFLFVHKINKKN